MQKLTLVPFFAQASQPMLTHKIGERVSDLMLVRAIDPKGTVSLSKSFAKWTIGVQAKSIFLLEEIIKCEIVSWRRFMRYVDIWSEIREMRNTALGHSSHRLIRQNIENQRT